MYPMVFHVILALSLLVLSAAPQMIYDIRHTPDHPAKILLTSPAAGSDLVDNTPVMPPIEESMGQTLGFSILPDAHSMPVSLYASRDVPLRWYGPDTKFPLSRVIVPPPEAEGIDGLAG